MSYRLELCIFKVPPSPNTVGGNKWKIQDVRVEWRQRTRRAIGTKAPPVPLFKARVICTRHSPKELDRDNLATSFKPVLDGLVQGRVLQNDTPKVLVGQAYSWEPTPRGQERITVVVESAE